MELVNRRSRFLFTLFALLSLGALFASYPIEMEAAPAWVLTPTEEPPTMTPTPVTPTETPLVPTETPTETPLIPTETPTETPIVPTETPTDSPIAPTETPTATSEPPTPTNTPVVLQATLESTPTPTNTSAAVEYVPATPRPLPPEILPMTGGSPQVRLPWLPVGFSLVLLACLGFFVRRIRH